MVSINHVFAGFAFIGFFLVIILLPLHMKAGNIGTCAFIIWTALLCINEFINSILWNNSDANLAPQWCDISSRIYTAGTITTSAASLCIARRLYLVTRDVSTDDFDEIEYNAKRWRAILCDYFLVVGIPVLHVVVTYVVQADRFVVYGNIGCRTALENTQLTYPLLLMWPIILSLAVAGYAGVIIYKLKRQRAQMQVLVQHNGYFRRLLGLIVVIFMCSFPPSLASIIFDATANSIEPWPGWDELHATINEVASIPYYVLQQYKVTLAALEYTRWIYVVEAVIFFGFFGFTSEARRLYGSVIMHVFPRSLTRSLKKRVTGTKSSNTFVLSTLQSDNFHPSRPRHARPLFRSVQETDFSGDRSLSGISYEHSESNTGLAQKPYIKQPSPVHDITSVLTRSPPHSPPLDDLPYGGPYAL